MTMLNSRIKRRRVQPAVALPAGIIEFSLFAPTISEAQVMGDFTDWHGRKMKKYADGTFRVRIALPDGDHPYKFRVRTKSWFYRPNQWVDITDPYAWHVDGNSNNGILKVREGKAVVDQYQWRHDDTPLPPNHKLVMYELHVPDFSGGEEDPHLRGKFKHVTAKLDYLAELGVNCIELMPIFEYPGDYAWGYTPQHLFAPESAYGPTEDLKRLIDEAHGRGMRVVLDVVYNHAYTGTPLAQIDHDYWFHHSPRDPSMSWGPQYNYEHHDAEVDVMPARKFVSENIKFWVEQYHIDGMRFDAAKQIENFDAMAMMSRVARETAGTKPFINIAEYVPEDPAVAGPPGSGKPMEAIWQDGFFWAIADGALAGRPVDLGRIKSVVNPLTRGFTDLTQSVNYVSNHDHRRLMPRLAQEAGVFHEHAFGRAHLACTLLLTAVGIPMLWMGEEFAEYKPKSMDPSKLDWTLLKNQPNKDLWNHYQTLIKLRKENEALSQNQCEFFFEDPERGVLAYHRWSGDDQHHVVVLVNFKDVAAEMIHIPNFPKPDAEWHNWIANRHEKADADGFHTRLDPLESRVLVWPCPGTEHKA